MLHMIGNAHLDPVWLWRWQEGCAEAIATCWSAVDRLDENPDFVFTRGEALIYRWIEELDPPLFARIRDFVAAGRWVIVNGWWIQPDCNIPGGEAMIRQALYGKRYFADRFGIDVTVGYNVDSFGHAATLPMLLQHTGSDSYVFMRPQAREMTLPAALFDWVAPDGSAVRAFHIQTGYQTATRALPLSEKIDQHLAMSAAAGHKFMCFYGVGNHGGGPTRANLAMIDVRRAAGDPVLYSDPVRFFAAVRGVAVPRVEAALQFHAIGCYSAASALKALNRRAEAVLGQAEAAAALAFQQAGAAYPHATFAALWQAVLFNQFHDTMGGSSIEPACEDAIHAYGAVIAGAEEQLNAAARHLARTVRRMPDPRDPQFLLMNFNDIDWDDILEAQPWSDFETVVRTLLDEDGVTVPFQSIQTEATIGGLQRIAFRVRVPAFGYRLLRFVADDPPRALPTKSATPRARQTLTAQTAGWRLEVDPATGAIQTLTNRRSGAALFRGPAHLGIVVDDPSDTWTHGVDRLPLEGTPMQCQSVTVTERGPVRQAIEICAGHGDSHLRTTILLPEDADLPVELRVTLDWHERHRLLRLAYPLGAQRFKYEVAAGWIAAPDDGREIVAQRWVRAVRDDLVVAIANDAKYSYAAEAGTLFITAVRAPVFAHHDPTKLQPGRHYRYMDQGEQRFRISLQAAPDLSRRDAWRLADSLLRPPVVTPHVSRGGQKPWRGKWLQTETTTSTVTTVKLAEDFPALVLRALELEGRPDRLDVAGAPLIFRPAASSRSCSGRMARDPAMAWSARAPDHAPPPLRPARPPRTLRPRRARSVAHGRSRESAPLPDLALSAAARRQSGELAPVGCGGARRGRRNRQAHPALYRLCRLPLVSRHGARILRGSRHRRPDEHPVRQHQGRP
jgi:alpha-mannosidase